MGARVPGAGPDSVPAARATFAAGEQNRYRQYASLLFENRGAENSGYVTDEFPTNLAEKVGGSDVGRWQETRDAGSVEEEPRVVQQRAVETCVNSTRPLVVSGLGGEMTLRGAGPIENVDRAVEEVGG